MSECMSLQIVDFNKPLDLTKEQIREFIANVEEMAKTGVPVEIPLEHHFAKSVYGRKITIPKGALIVGKIHKHANLCIVAKGQVSVLSIDGVKKLEAGDTFVASPGAKRVIFAHEEAVWINAHGTDETDVEKIEEEFIAKDYTEVIEGHESVKQIKEGEWLG